MASQVKSDGTVQAPLNISAPAPIVNLRGFKFAPVDQKVAEVSESQAFQPQIFLAASKAEPRLQREVAADVQITAVTSTPVPRLPQSSVGLPGQLPAQLGIVPGLAPPAPSTTFPLAQFQGSWAGNGLNTIFRPRPDDDQVFPNGKGASGPDDNILELNLTTEQMTFGGTIGDIPNRGLGDQSDIILTGFPYLQTVQDVTNTDTGLGDNPVPTGIHFETGMWLQVPPSGTRPKNPATVVRMASIPHGTTVNAQGLVPQLVKTSNLGGRPGAPNFDAKENQVDTTPFFLGSGTPQPFPSMDANNQGTFRIPQNLKPFVDKGTITTAIIKNPNIVLKNAIQGQKIIETIAFEVHTGPPKATMNGGGTANISFLAGTQNPITTASPGAKDNPNAHAEFMTSKYWIETVEYQVRIPNLTTKDTILLKPIMPNSLAPTPIFAITPPPNTSPKNPVKAKTIAVPGVQIQSSQNVKLNFGPPSVGVLTWPHVSVATLVPTDPQPFQMT